MPHNAFFNVAMGMPVYKMQMFRRFLIMLIFIIGTPSLAQAELRLGEWKNYGAMAEQGGVCAAFARIMELQGIIDTQTGDLWLERRKFSGAVVRQASLLEGLPSASTAEIDDLVNRYAQWLLTNLVSEQDGQSIDPAAHSSASQMIAEVCTGLYDRADKAIFAQNPDLESCSPVVQDTPTAQCVGSDGPSEDDQRKIKLLLQNNMSLSNEVSVLRKKITELQSTITAQSTTALADTAPSAVVTEREVAIDLPLPKPDNPVKKQPTQPAATTVGKKTSKAAGTANNPGTGAAMRFAAQLGSYRAEAGAQQGIALLQTQFPVVLAKAGLRVVEAELGSGQALYRIVTGPLTRSAATDICTAMWDKKLGCLLKASK